MSNKPSGTEDCPTNDRPTQLQQASGRGISIGGNVHGSVIATGSNVRIVQQNTPAGRSPTADLEEVSTQAEPRPTAPPTRASLRRVLNELLATDADFDAFCSDYFEAVYKRFASGMDRVSKGTILLDVADRSLILKRLREDRAADWARVAHLLQYE